MLTHVLNISILFIFFKNSVCIESIEVTVDQGVLAGAIEKSFFKNKEYYAFRGIPYAEPPLGSLRFKPPQPLEKWDGTYEAYKNKPTCLQICTRMRNNEPFGFSGSEDCLYLSIYTPGLEGDYPVIVFDFNDNFKTGFNGSDTYSPDFFIEEDVIVVTITHRLNVFGYLTTEDEVIPPNNGIRDFLLGLNWVQNNIRKFGGDPTKVTLMGYKGGAALVNLLLYSEKAKGLFSAVILQGGTAFEPIYFFEDAKSKAFELGEVLEIHAEDSQTLLEELQKIAAVTLKQNEVMVRDNEELKKYHMNINIFAPTVEKNHKDAIITALPENSKIVVDVPVIIGLTSREGLDLVEDFLVKPKLIEQVFGGLTMLFPIRTGFRFDRDSTVYNQDASTEINNIYYKGGYLHQGNILEYSVLLGDSKVSYAIDKASKHLAKELESPVYYYMFDYRGQLNENMNMITRYSAYQIQLKGATTTDDLCYLHLCNRIKKTYEYINGLVTKQPEFKTLDKMVRMWSNFAKTRNPTPDPKDDVLKGITWEPINKENEKANYLHISKALKMKTEPLGKRSKFWDQFLDKYSKLAVDGVVTDSENVEEADKIEIKDLKYEQEEQIDELESEILQVDIKEKSSNKANIDNKRKDASHSGNEKEIPPVVDVTQKVKIVNNDNPFAYAEPVNLPLKIIRDEF